MASFTSLCNLCFHHKVAVKPSAQISDCILTNVSVLTSVSKFNFCYQFLCQELSLLLYQSKVYSKSVIIFIVERQHNSSIVA